MKRLFCAIIAVVMIVSAMAISSVSFAETKTYVIFEDDFEAYTPGEVIPAGKNAKWTSMVKNDEKKCYAYSVEESNNKICRFEIRNFTSNSGPELRKAFTAYGFDDLTIKCRAKSNASSMQLNIVTDGAINVTVANISSSSWVDVEIKIDFINGKYTSKVGGTTSSGELKPIADIDSFQIALKQMLRSESETASWDDLVVTSSKPLATQPDKSNWFAWTIPDESKAKGTAIDSSFLLDKPAGKHGFVKPDGDKFVFEDGTRADFWGTNIVFNAAFMSKSDSEAVADRIARCGYNIVRLHMFESSRKPNIFQDGTTRVFNEESLDKLFYFTSCLKERGVYIYMDLLVYRKALAADGIVDADLVDTKGWGKGSHFDPYMIMLQKEYANMLLTRVNPYTNLAYKDDPQMALMSIVNESSVGGNIVKESSFPPEGHYEDVLDGLFNTWLSTKYDSDSSLKSAWKQDGRTGLVTGESLKDKTVKVRRDIHDQKKYSDKRRRDTNEFFEHQEEAFYSDMISYLKNDVGVKIPITGSTLGALGAIHINMYACAQVGDFIARNNYTDAASSTIKDGAHLESISQARVYSKPYIVTEWCCNEPSKHIAESSLMVSTYARFQGWNMIKFQMWYTNNLPTGQYPIDTKFVEFTNPVRTALAPATGQNFQRGDIKPAETEYFYTRTYADETDPDNYSLVAYQDTVRYAKTGTMYDTVNYNASAADPKVKEAIDQKMKSDSKYEISDQIYWDPDKQHFFVQTEYTQGAAGYLARNTELDKVIFDMDNLYYTAILSSATKDTIDKSNRLLLSVAAHCENTDRVLSDDGKEILKTGKAPVMVEPVCGNVTLKTKDDIEVYALTSSGERKEQLPVSTDKNGYKVFTLKEEHKSLNFEIVVLSNLVKGDANGDKNLNNRDAARILQYRADWNVYIDELGSRVIGSGRASNRDAVRILQFLSDWDVDF